MERHEEEKGSNKYVLCDESYPMISRQSLSSDEGSMSRPHTELFIFWMHYEVTKAQCQGLEETFVAHLLGAHWGFRNIKSVNCELIWCQRTLSSSCSESLGKSVRPW